MSSSPNEVIIFGGGVQELPDGGGYMPSEISQQRLDRFLEYYNDNRQLFRSRQAQVMCTGGYGLLAAGIERPDNIRAREGIVAADYLVRAGIAHRLIRPEWESTSTLRNITGVIDLGYLNPQDYGPDRKLGGISHPHHLFRAEDGLEKVGVTREAFVHIPTHEEDNALRELILRVGYKALLLGAEGRDEILAREALPARLRSLGHNAEQ
jgi:uncharacterized SAM-binding protein YcdF (DUF218 family)